MDRGAILDWLYDNNDIVETFMLRSVEDTHMIYGRGLEHVLLDMCEHPAERTRGDLYRAQALGIQVRAGVLPPPTSLLRELHHRFDGLGILPSDEVMLSYFVGTAERGAHCPVCLERPFGMPARQHLGGKGDCPFGANKEMVAVMGRGRNCWRCARRATDLSGHACRNFSGCDHCYSRVHASWSQLCSVQARDQERVIRETQERIERHLGAVGSARFFLTTDRNIDLRYEERVRYPYLRMSHDPIPIHHNHEEIATMERRLQSLFRALEYEVESGRMLHGDEIIREARRLHAQEAEERNARRRRDRAAQLERFRRELAAEEQRVSSSLLINF